MLFIVEKPKHWYTRPISISIPVWPKWLAQRLCNHENYSATGWQEHKAIGVCRDCYKCIIVPNTCTHHPDSLVVDTVVSLPYPTGAGVHNVPDTWHCLNCGQSFTREMQCPECDVQMEITEHMNEFSARFLCTQCGAYRFREDL